MFGSVIFESVWVAPSHRNRSPFVPPMIAKVPSGLQAIVFKSSPEDMNPVVDILVNVVPSHFMRTAVSPTIKAYDPSGFHAINRNALVTGCPINVSVPFWYL